jgi:hypothetical protein
MVRLTLWENQNFGGRAVDIDFVNGPLNNFGFGVSSFKTYAADWVFLKSGDGDVMAVYGPQDVGVLDMQRPNHGVGGAILGGTQDWNDCIQSVSFSGDPTTATNVIGASVGHF